MADALQTLAQAGAVPRFGDDDGGRLFDGSRNRTTHLTGPLATCAILFNRPDFKAACPQLPEETLWLLGQGGARTYDALTAAAPRARTQWFEASGLACIASSDPLPHTLFVDAGVQGFGNAGHGHADALSVQLVAGGRSVLTDPGTYCYPVEVAGRNVFRGTAAHNTLEVDGLDQSEPGGSFDWRSLPKVRAERWVQGHGGALLVASHDGYARLVEPVIHRRWVAALGNGLYIIRDVATGQGTHSLRVRWHLGPGFRRVEAPGASSDAIPGRIRSDAHHLQFQGPESITLHLLGANAGHAGSSGEDYSFMEGVWSEAYGRKTPSLVVCYGKKAALPAEFAMAVVLAGQDAPAAGHFEVLEAGPGGSSVYRYRDGHRRLLAFFHDGEGPWRWNGWSSDAAFVALETDAAGRVGQRIFLVGGSFLESTKGTALSCNRLVDCWEWTNSAGGEQVFCSDPEAVEKVEPENLDFALLSGGQSS
jgi:hypothetical protein